MELQTEVAEMQFRLQGASRCVLVPIGYCVDTLDVGEAAISAFIEGEGEALERYVVRIGDGEQQALDFFELEATLKECSAPRRGHGRHVR